jgi:hypothetical protein|tara:strand:+ start:196 stop:300 length:105 start_codon:yes stop_codon:yes gene_type:complete
MKRDLDTPAIGFAIEFTEVNEQIKKVINNIIEKS